MDGEPSAFAQWLRGFMEQERLETKDAARRAGVTAKTILEWLQGRGPLHPDQMRLVLEGTGGPHRCQFLDFTAMVAEYNAMRRVVLALTGGKQERKKVEAILTEAERLKKLERDQ